MARPRRCRRVCTEPDYLSFAPDGIPCGGRVTLAVEEYEVIRLIDLEKLTHEQCAKQMDISRTTVTEIYESAREKIAVRRFRCSFLPEKMPAGHRCVPGKRGCAGTGNGSGAPSGHSRERGTCNEDRSNI